MSWQTASYIGTYPSQWSEWVWNFDYECYVRYRLISPGDYEWDDYTPPPSTPLPQSRSSQYHYSDYSDSPQYYSSYSSYTSSSPASDFSFSNSDRDSGYDSSTSSSDFSDLLDHPESWTVNPFLAYGFPPAATSSKHDSPSKSKSKSTRGSPSKGRSPRKFGSDTSHSSHSRPEYSDEGFFELPHHPSPAKSTSSQQSFSSQQAQTPAKDPWITLYGRHSRELNMSPTLLPPPPHTRSTKTHYISSSILKDLGLWEECKRNLSSTSRGREEWIPSEEEGEEKVKVLGTWSVRWEGINGKEGKEKTAFRVFRDSRRKCVLGMSVREARKVGIL